MTEEIFCLDAGHGWENAKVGVFDTGAVYKRKKTGETIREADIALAWTLTLKQKFVEAGIGFFLTRKGTNDSVPVGSRARRAEQAGCKRFLSIHVNSADGATGTETIYREGAGDKAWADMIQKCALEALGLKDRGVKDESQTARGKLAVMSFNGPACLLELGFGDTENDLERMLDPARRIAFADAVVKAIKAKGWS